METLQIDKIDVDFKEMLQIIYDCLPFGGKGETEPADRDFFILPYGLANGMKLK